MDTDMAIKQEKRFNQREKVTAGIDYFPFAANPSYKCGATAINSSQGGLCFKTMKPLKPGQCICIHSKGSELRSCTLAQVRWCQEKQAKPWMLYNIGASYL